MAATVNETAKKAVENATQNATQNATAATNNAAAQGPIENLLEPLITLVLGLPAPVQIMLVLGLGAGAVLYGMHRKAKKENTELDADDMEDRKKRTFLMDVEMHGAKTAELLRNKATGNAEREVGRIVKVKESSTEIKAKGEQFEDKDGNIPDRLQDKFDADEEVFRQDFIQYVVVPGDNKVKRTVKWLIYKAVGIFVDEADSNPMALYYDIPVHGVTVDDKGVAIRPSVHLQFKNGMWQATTWESQQRVTEMTMSDAHEDFVETTEQLPEIYSMLNTDTASNVNIMNTKSENMRKYKEDERKGEKKDGMN